jgi:hypothetical protein
MVASDKLYSILLYYISILCILGIQFLYLLYYLYAQS